MTIRVLTGDCLEVLRTLPDESCHMCCTSPPYWGLRDYGVQGAGGLEETPEAHLAWLVDVFREVRRVLRSDGCLLLNYGDAYAGSPPRVAYGDQGKNSVIENDRRWMKPSPGLKTKDLMMLPARVALALQADGWWLRSMMPWVKRSAMPESVMDRPASAIEYVFLLTKSARYFWDAEAVRKAYQPDSVARVERGRSDSHKWADGGPGNQTLARDISGACPSETGRNFRNSDLFYASLEPPHGLISGADGPLALDVNPAGFSSVAVYGSYRIGSPDCSVHGHRDALARALRCGELQVSSDPPRNLGIRDHHVEAQEGVAYAITEDQCAFLSNSSAARLHSTEIRRMAASLKQGDSCDDTQAPGTEYKQPPDHSDAMSGHTPENNILPGASSDEPLNCPSEQTLDHIVGIATFKDPPNGCLCQYVGKVEKRQDHFAVFPPKLIEPLIKAGTSEKGVCAACGAPWVRELEKPTGGATGQSWHDHSQDDVAGNSKVVSSAGYQSAKTLGWSPSCACKAEPAPATVLDPFFGAGTTGLVADRLGRNCIGIELNPEYAQMARQRLTKDAGMFAEVTE